MSNPKSTIHRFVRKPGLLSGRPQSHLDWNVRHKPAITPRREWQSIARQLGPLWMQAPSGFEPNGSAAVIQ